MLQNWIQTDPLWAFFLRFHENGRIEWKKTFFFYQPPHIFIFFGAAFHELILNSDPIVTRKKFKFYNDRNTPKPNEMSEIAFYANVFSPCIFSVHFLWFGVFFFVIAIVSGEVSSCLQCGHWIIVIYK